jgi:hypothetical protein
MNYLNAFKSLFCYLCALFIVTTSVHLYAEHETKEKISVGDAFKTINQRLYRLDETKAYCNLHFSKQSSRNNDAYDEWELQYNFFLREFDKNYAQWKSGFNELEQQHFTSLEFIERERIKLEIIEDYEDGGLDKCYNFKPALQRPRNNIELAEQESINLILNNSLNGFVNNRHNTGAHSLCAWEQTQAIKAIDLRDSGKDAKAQKALLKEMKKSKDKIDKKIKSNRLSSYKDMIKEVYKAPALSSLSYSQYRFALCQREKSDIDSIKFKKVLPSLLNCQETSANVLDLLGNCINKAMNEK